VVNTFRATGDGWFSSTGTADSQQASFGTADYNECTYSRRVPDGNFNPA